MAQSKTDKSPTNYMSTSSKRIVIKEKGKKSSSNGPLPPTITKEIIILENQEKPEEEEKKTSSENLEIKTKSAKKEVIIVQKDRARTPSPSYGCTLSPNDTGTRPKTPTLDPAEPQSHTVLSRSASPKICKSKSNNLAPPELIVGQEMVSPKTRSRSSSEISNRSTTKTTNKYNVEGSRSTREITNKPSMEEEDDEEETVIQRAKRSLNVASVPRAFRVLPDGCKAKYERYTYLPGVRAIPSSTPLWKVPILQKKNKEVIDHFMARLENEKVQLEMIRKEKERREATPEWKRPLVKVSQEARAIEEKKKIEKALQETKDLERFKSLPPWRQELLLKKKERERIDALPSWQKELVQKKRVANMKTKYEVKPAPEIENTTPSWTSLTLRKTKAC